MATLPWATGTAWRRGVAKTGRHEARGAISRRRRIASEHDPALPRAVMAARRFRRPGRSAAGPSTVRAELIAMAGAVRSVIEELAFPGVECQLFVGNPTRGLGAGSGWSPSPLPAGEDAVAGGQCYRAFLGHVVSGGVEHGGFDMRSSAKLRRPSCGRDPSASRCQLSR